MFLSVQLRYHIAAYRTGFQDKELSTQDADHEVFKKLAQRPHERAVKEGVLNRFLPCTAPGTPWRNCQLRCKKSIADPEGIPDDQPSEGSLIIIEAPHSGGPRLQKATPSTVTPSSPIRSSRADPLTNKRYNALLETDGCQRDLSTPERELSEYADTHDRRGTPFWANDGSPRQRSAHFLTTGKIV